MGAINSSADLKAAILLLEIKQKEEALMLKVKVRQAYEGIKPVNLIKNALNGVIASPELKGKLISSGVGLASGYLLKILFRTATSTPLTKIAGVAIQYGVTSLIAKNPDAVKSMGNGLLKLIKKVAKRNSIKTGTTEKDDVT